MEQVEAFADNWTYIRTELNWLDRVLATAVARQRKETKDVDRVSRSRADQVTSHWWKGLVSLDGVIGGDSPVENSRRPAPVAKPSYQQQLEARIQASQQKGIALGLPILRQRLQLTPFEKNLVLMALAPEINRRYGRIYNYLQETDQKGASGLPTIDLILRILCRNDKEWQTARQALTTHAKLLRHGVILLPITLPEPFLCHPVKLPDLLVDYLLADRPNPNNLDHLLLPLSPLSPSSLLHLSPDSPSSSPLLRSSLILPDSLLAALQHLCHRVQHGNEIHQGLNQTLPTAPPGTIALFVGAEGTGKTSAARAIAQTLQMPLAIADLGVLSPAESQQLLQEITHQAPTVLLLKSAQAWFGCSASLAPESLRRFLQERLHSPSLTLLCMERRERLRPIWRRHISPILDFPLPDKKSRLALWQQAFPEPLTLASDISWGSLARLPLTGGEIQAIARDAAIFAIAQSPQTPIGMKQLVQACELRELKVSKSRNRKSKVGDRPTDSRSATAPTSAATDAPSTKDSPKNTQT
jgi:hypothetical protein